MKIVSVGPLASAALGREPQYTAGQVTLAAFAGAALTTAGTASAALRTMARRMGGKELLMALLSDKRRTLMPVVGCVTIWSLRGLTLRVADRQNVWPLMFNQSLPIVAV